jgi:hypothetical protein
MKHVIETRFLFKEFKEVFGKHKEISFVFADDFLHFLGRRDGVLTHKSYDALIHSEIDMSGLRIGFSMETALLFKLVSLREKEEKLDECTISILEEGLIIKINEYQISTNLLIFDYALLEVLTNMLLQPNDFPMSDAQWLYYVGRTYKDALVAFAPGWAFGRFGNVLYLLKRKVVYDFKLALPVSILGGFVKDSDDKVTLGDMIVLQRQDGVTLISQTYKADTSSLDEYIYAAKMKRYIKIKLNLYPHREIIASVRGSRVEFHCVSKKILITADTREILEIEVRDLEIEYIDGSFDMMSTLTDVVDGISFTDLNLLRCISGNEEGVNLYVTRYCALVAFGRDRFAMVPLVKEK